MVYRPETCGVNMAVGHANKARTKIARNVLRARSYFLEIVIRYV
jgi:hypothetical protein